MKTSISKRITNFHSLTLILLALLMAGCSGGSGKDTGNDGNDGNNEGIVVSGMVRDANRHFLEAVEAYDDNGVLAQSDSNGHLQFRLPKGSSGPLRLRKTGYANQTIPLQIIDDQAQFEATMGKRGAVISIDPTQPVDVASTHGTRVSLPANALVDADGNPVSGNVDLTITPVDVSSDDELGVFPGAFAGEDADGVVPLILSYGTVEYRFTQDGKELNLAAGQSAEIELPIFVENHPDGSSIDVGDAGALWYLDEVTGLWKQEGMGTVVESVASPTGLALRANVGHFSWWNHDIAPEICMLTINTSGLRSGTEFILKGKTEIRSYPRSASTKVSESGAEYITPRGNQVELSATANTNEGIFEASQTVTCNGETGTTTLVFDNPTVPLINYFEGRTLPRFSLELDPDDSDNTRWVLDGQDAIFDWVVTGADRVMLVSDQGHDTTLGNNSGSVQFPLELNGSHADEYQFTLIAETVDGGEDRIVKVLQYGDGKPVIHSADVWQDASDENVQAATLSWEVEGADSIQIWVGINDDVSPLLLLEDNDPPQTGATVIDTVQKLLPFLGEWCDNCGAANLPVTLLFTNQYGTSEATVYVSVYDPRLLCAGGEAGRSVTTAMRVICE